MQGSLVAALAFIFSLAGCGQTADSQASIVGRWEMIFHTRRSPTPPASASIDNADPVGFIEVTFRRDGAFTARYEMEGAVTSVIGTWSAAPDWSAKNKRTSFRVRTGMINGKPVPREARDHGVEAYLMSQDRLFFPSGVDPATGGFKSTFGILKRP